MIAAPGITIEGVEFSGARGGAAVRTEAGHGVKLKGCLIRDNDIGLLGADAPSAEVRVENTEFADNRAGNLQVGQAGRLVLQFNYIHRSGAVISRASETYLLYNRVTQETGDGPFGIELPEGGRALAIGNIFHRGPAPGAEAILTFGQPSGASGAELDVINNTFVDERTVSNFLAIASSETMALVVENNIFDGVESGVPTLADKFGAGNFWGDARLVDRTNYDFRLKPDSPAVNAGVALEGPSTPAYQYSHPACGEERVNLGVIDIGAEEYGNGGRPACGDELLLPGFSARPGVGSSPMPRKRVGMAAADPRAAALGTIGLALSSASAVAGGTLQLEISMNASGTQPAGLQWTLGYGATDFSTVTVAASPAATAAGKTTSCAGGSGSLTCLLYGLDGNAIGNGTLAVVTLQLSATPSVASLPVQLTNGVSASPIGEEIATTTSGGTVTVQQPAVVAVTVSPASATLTAGQTQQFTAAVTGATDTAVTWSVSPAGVGTVSAAGLYTAPGSISSPQQATVQATSVADTTKSAMATVTLQPAVAVTVSPASVTLTAGQTQQFTAAVTGTTNTAVTWSVSPAGVGTISASGLYTAPSSISSSQQVTVQATSVADTAKTATATVTLQPVVTVTVSPSSVTLTAGQTQQFTAAVTGTTNTAVTWSVSLVGVGTVSAVGLYTAPSSISSPQQVTVQATSVADTTKTATATVTLQPVVTVTVSPSSVTLTAGQTQQFTATVTGTTDTTVTWSVSPAGAGTITTSGLYTAPASVSSAQQVIVQATSTAGTTKAASVPATATVTLQPVVTVTVSPSSVTLTAGQTQQFTATVTGTPNTAVTWSLSPVGVGTITTSGLYTPPVRVTSTQRVTVRATSVADATKSDTATVKLQSRGWR